MKKLVSKYKEPILIANLIIIHLVGLIGLQSNYRDEFILLTPFTLFLVFLFILVANTDKKIYSFFGLSFIIGMAVEIIGVKTGFPFGEYYYTEVLGWSLLEVPLIIGINWFVIAIGILSFLNQWETMSYWVKSFIGAFLMTLMDVLIEPFAIAGNLWVWNSVEVPFSNYLAWFGVSFFIFLIGFKLLADYRNKIATFVMLVYSIFFALNNFLT